MGQRNHCHKPVAVHPENRTKPRQAPLRHWRSVYSITCTFTQRPPAPSDRVNYNHAPRPHEYQLRASGAASPRRFRRTMCCSGDTCPTMSCGARARSTLKCHARATWMAYHGREERRDRVR
jgi:hypothetical protein